MKQVAVHIPMIVNPYTFESEIHKTMQAMIRTKYIGVSAITIGDDSAYLHFDDEKDATAFILKHGENYKISF